MPDLKPQGPADVVVVGAGPVGLSCARALTASGLHVLLVEAGGPLPSGAANEAVSAEVQGDERWGGLAWKTWRALGGTSWAWHIDRRGRPAGVRHAGYEDAVARRRLPGLRAWPWPPELLEELQARALPAVGLPGVRSADLRLAPGPAPGLAAGRYAFGSALPFRTVGLETCAELLLGTRVLRLVPGETGPDGLPAVAGVLVRRPDGTQKVVPARDVVLAASAVENARLALQLREDGGLPPGTALGSGLMDRPRVDGVLRLTAPGAGALARALERCALQGQGDELVMERWCVPDDAVQDGVPSAGVVLRPALDAPAWRRTAEHLTRRVLLDLPLRALRRSPRRLGPAVLRAVVLTYGARSALFRRLLTVWDLEWGDWRDRAWRGCRTWTATASVEQLPDPSNRVELADSEDDDGVRTARVVWGRPVQRADLEPALQRLSSAVRAAGHGELEWQAEPTTVSSHHLSGTLAAGTGRGTATEPSGRLRGSSNAWAAGACLLPTSGHANPTLLAVALALHVADGVVARTQVAAAVASEALSGTPRGRRSPTGT